MVACRLLRFPEFAIYLTYFGQKTAAWASCSKPPGLPLSEERATLGRLRLEYW
jgi:hypothetical protein